MQPQKWLKTALITSFSDGKGARRFEVSGGGGQSSVL